MTIEQACRVILGNKLAAAITETVKAHQVEIEEAQAEAAWERQQQSLTESGGADDSSYRRDLINAGRGHLLR